MRVFIAIEFEEEIKEYLEQVQKKAMLCTKGGNFTAKENFHLTLHFIGEADKEEVELLKEAMYETANYNRQFQLELSSIGLFERGNKAIVWMGTQKSKELMHLYQSLAKSLSRQGFAPKRQKLSPHITIGREVSLAVSPELLQKNVGVEPKKIVVNKLSLMESVRIGSKLVYRQLYSSKLKDEKKKVM